MPTETCYRVTALFREKARVLDEGIANVTAALARLGLWESTLLVFVADNGGAINIAQGAFPRGKTKGGVGNHLDFEFLVHRLFIICTSGSN